MDKLIDVRDIISKNSLPILIGNGFSINISEKFDYESLMELVKCKKLSTPFQKLLNMSNKINIEDILKRVEISRDVLDCLDNVDVDFQTLINEIKVKFIEVISEIQPIKEFYVDRLDDSKTRFDILKKFSKVFTTNYDLSLYYIVLENSSFKDSFGYPHYSNILTFHHQNHVDSDKIPIYYIHGNLMIFREPEHEVYTSKVSYQKGFPILKQIVERVENNHFPIIVTEGLSNQKLRKIYSNDYLTYCWNSLDGLEEDEIVVYGHSLSDSDQHIVELIDKKFKRVYYGIYSNTKQNQYKIKSKFSQSQISFFDSKSLFKPTDKV